MLDFGSFLPFGIFSLLLPLLAILVRKANLLFYGPSFVSLLLTFPVIFLLYNLPLLIVSFDLVGLLISFLANFALVFLLFLTCYQYSLVYRGYELD